jgi:oligopeptide/dipeptide ABC transporter ATP-binding protein
VEIGPADNVIRAPLHPYTQSLVSVIPVPETGRRPGRILLHGEAPSASKIPGGCRFHPRCPLYRRLGEPELCRDSDPVLTAAGAGGTDLSGISPDRRQAAACHFAKEGS